ncbi:C-type lectin-like isoform X1 [Mauremys reevesii]|uniref:C-type lectin-like isoform X1 n=1 Tax=Mauremys reevesii TaxID=260615 RepID=UPI00193FF331|nr:C-type lectin-like isoform X1 [Mauremys reevesii]XP_039376628.1 C-type lectin-like isoform X1 [Mauremys reevesii]
MGPVAYFSLCLLGCLIFNPSLAGVQAVSCPGCWLPFQDSCYRYIAQEKNWTDAEAECQHHWPGAHLASIHSAEEKNMLAHYSKPHPPKVTHVWIGLSDPKKVSAQCPLCLWQPLPSPWALGLCSVRLLFGAGVAPEQDFHWNGVKRGCNRLGFHSQDRSPAPGAEYKLLLLIFTFVTLAPRDPPHRGRGSSPASL